MLSPSGISFGFDPVFAYGPVSPTENKPISGFDYLHHDGGDHPRGVWVFRKDVSRDGGSAASGIHQNNRFSPNHAGKKRSPPKGCTGRSAVGSMKYTCRKTGYWNTAKRELFSSLNRSVFRLTRKFSGFFLRWTKSGPGAVHQSRVEGIRGWNGAGFKGGILQYRKLCYYQICLCPNLDPLGDAHGLK